MHIHTFNHTHTYQGVEKYFVGLLANSLTFRTGFKSIISVFYSTISIRVFNINFSTLNL